MMMMLDLPEDDLEFVDSIVNRNHFDETQDESSGSSLGTLDNSRLESSRIDTPMGSAENVLLMEPSVLSSPKARTKAQNKAAKGRGDDACCVIY